MPRYKKSRCCYQHHRPAVQCKFVVQVAGQPWVGRYVAVSIEQPRQGTTQARVPPSCQICPRLPSRSSKTSRWVLCRERPPSRRLVQQGALARHQRRICTKNIRDDVIITYLPEWTEGIGKRKDRTVTWQLSELPIALPGGFCK